MSSDKAVQVKRRRGRPSKYPVAGLKITPQEAAVELLARRRGRRNLIDFMRYCWWLPTEFLVGSHTQAIADRVTAAVDGLERGESTYLAVQVCFGHGKSVITSQALPAFILGRLRDMQPDMILSGYGGELVEGFSRQVQSIVSGPRYGQLFPGLAVARDKSAAYNWRVEGSAGEVYAVGLGGAITGRHAHFIALDDFFKNREEAESPTVREGRWRSFKNDLMTRRHDSCFTLITATPWHVDDIFGRIRREMEDNAEFPRFEFLTFPAECAEYPTGYLFPERFSPQWYIEQRAMLDPYEAAGLMDCNPQQAHTSKFLPMAQWPRWDVLPAPEAHHRLYAAFDPSGGRGAADEDYAVVWVVLALEDGRYLLVDGWAGRAIPEDQVARCYGLHRKWVAMGYGDGIHQLSYEVLKKDEGWIISAWRAAQERLRVLGDEAWRLAVVPHYPVENKESRIERLAQWISQSWLQVPAGAEFLMRETDNEFGAALRLLADQASVFPHGDHDDAPDALIATLDSAKAGGPGRALIEDEALEAIVRARHADQEAVPDIRRIGIDGRRESVPENPWLAA